MTLLADATPTKRFFIDNLTRDLSLEDAILDLVDNSIDAFIRLHEIDVTPAILKKPTLNGAKPGPAPIQVHVSEDEIRIVDTCGGISVERAKNDVFRIGRVDDEIESALGVYGIGLKRAIFKMGRDITIESHTKDDGFLLKLDVDKWSGEKDWTFPFDETEKARPASQAGTSITIRRLTPEVKHRVKDTGLLKSLSDAIATTYTLFLSRFLTVTLNGKAVPGRPLPIGASKEIEPGFKVLKFGNVDVEVISTLAARIDGEWSQDRAGWYVLCNGRVVVSADKTDLTGWGTPGGPQFVSKYSGFVGIAFFFSKDPASLPWTTTKRGLNVEAQAFQATRQEMKTLARPVLSFLNSMYPSDLTEDVEEREVADKVKVVDVRAVAARPPTERFIATVIRSEKRTVNVQYKAAKADVARIKKVLNKPRWGANKVGQHTFEYFLKMELPE